MTQNHELLEVDIVTFNNDINDEELANNDNNINFDQINVNNGANAANTFEFDNNVNDEELSNNNNNINFNQNNNGADALGVIEFNDNINYEELAFNNHINFGLNHINFNQINNNEADDLAFGEDQENLGNYDSIDVLNIGLSNLKIHTNGAETHINLRVNAKNTQTTSINFLENSLTIERNSTSKIATTNSIKKIEIIDNLTVTVNIDFPVEEIELFDGQLNLTYTSSNPCTTTLTYNKGSSFTLSSGSGFDMKIVNSQGGEQVEYALKTNNKSISSKEINAIIDLADAINSSEGDNLDSLLRDYSKLIEKDGFIHDLVQQNDDLKEINNIITDNFFRLAGVAKKLEKKESDTSNSADLPSEHINEVAEEKSEGINLADLPSEMLSHIASFLKPSDLNYSYEVVAYSASLEVSTTGSVEDIDGQL